MGLFTPDLEPLYSGKEFRIPSEFKKDSRLFANPEDKSISENQSAILHEGIMRHPIVQGTTSVPSDFYRRGGPLKNENIVTRQTTKLEFNRLANQWEQVPSEPSTTADGLWYRDPTPRQLADQEEKHEKDSIGTIRLMGRPNRNPKMAPVDLIPPYNKFFLESVQEGHSERSQIVETFGDFFVFFYGERPAVYNFSGTLLNASNINWAEDFYFYYDNFLRGTKCVEAGAVLTITYGYRQIEGFLMGINTSTQAINEQGVGLTFQVLVTDRKYLKLSPDFGVVEIISAQDYLFGPEFKVDSSILEMLKTGSSGGTNYLGQNTVNDILKQQDKANSTKPVNTSNIYDIVKSYPASKGVMKPNSKTGGMEVIA